MVRELMYQVEKIVGHSTINDERHFIIKWRGYPSSQNTFEPIQHLTNVKKMVEEYEAGLSRGESKMKEFRVGSGGAGRRKRIEKAGRRGRKGKEVEEKGEEVGSMSQYEQVTEKKERKEKKVREPKQPKEPKQPRVRKNPKKDLDKIEIDLSAQELFKTPPPAQIQPLPQNTPSPVPQSPPQDQPSSSSSQIPLPPKKPRRNRASTTRTLRSKLKSLRQRKKKSEKKSRLPSQNPLKTKRITRNSLLKHTQSHPITNKKLQLDILNRENQFKPEPVCIVCKIRGDYLIKFSNEEVLSFKKGKVCDDLFRQYPEIFNRYFEKNRFEKYDYLITEVRRIRKQPGGGAAGASVAHD